jgi:hypothetical protein
MARLVLLIALAACGQIDVAPRPSSVTLVTSSFVCDCMPVVVTPNTGTGEVTIEYTAGDSPTHFDITGARYVLGSGAVLSVDFSPSGSGPLAAGEKLSVVHDTMHAEGINDICDYFGSVADLEIDVQGPSGLVVLHTSIEVHCSS